MLAVSFYGDDGFRTGTATRIVLGEHLQGQESVGAQGPVEPPECHL
jgi:hypothetical protein